MSDEELLKNEKLEKMLSPHPLSFMRYQALCIFLLIWGFLVWWMVNFSDFKQYFENPWIAIFVWGIVLLIFGIIVALITIRWSIFFMYAGIFFGGVGLMLWQSWIASVGVFILVYTVGMAIVGFF